MKARNFTGADLNLAQQAVTQAQFALQTLRDKYNLEISWGGSHVHYANSHTAPAMNAAQANLDASMETYNKILQAIDAANNSQLKAAQTSFVTDTLNNGNSVAPTAKDYSTYIYIGIAVLVIAFFWKS